MKNDVFDEIVESVGININNRKKYDNIVIGLLVLGIILCVGASWDIQYIFGESQIVKQIQQFIQAVLVGFVLTLLGKLGTLLPVERRLRELSTAIIAATEIQRVTNTRLAEAIGLLRDYAKYQNARENFGFNSIDNIEIINNPIRGGVSIRPTNLALNVIKDAKNGDSIFYMTTYLGEDNDYLNAIMEAVDKGVKIKLLLMMPWAKAPVVEARLHDVSLKNHRRLMSKAKTTEEKLDIFIGIIRPKAEALIVLRNEIRENVINTNRGSLDIRFYEKSLHYPLIYVDTVMTSGKPEAICFTGFYATGSAEEMPYIEWRGGDFQIHQKFKEVFDEKWSACEKHTEIRY